MATLRLLKSKRIDLLHGVQLFSGCSNGELGKIASLTTEVHAKAGKVLTKRGDPGLEFFIIVEGKATATRKGVHLATLGPGSFFGELALLDGGKRTATVIADTDMRLLVLSRGEFNGLHHVAPSVSAKMLAELGARLRSADEKLDPAPALGKRVGPWAL
jgi:CRP/FNR family transcriptional regulator, cyclic AMP receptor protein